MQHKVHQSYVCRYSKRKMNTNRQMLYLAANCCGKAVKLGYGVTWREQGPEMTGSELATGHGHGCT